MSRYILKRLVMLIPVLIGVTFMVYFILSLSPGDTAATIPTLSTALYCLVALMIPMGRAMAIATRIDQKASFAVLGKEDMMVVNTGRFVE